MTDLDEAVRHHLSRLVDTAPMPPTLASIEASAQTEQRPGIRWQLAVGAMATLGATVWVLFALLAPSVATIGTADESAVRFGPAVLLDLPEVVNTKLMLTIVGDDLLTGNSYATDESWQLEITRTRPDTLEPEVVLQIPTGGILASLDASGPVILAVVSQHMTARPPLAVISTDGGATWSQNELPTNEAGNRDLDASTGGTIGDGQFAIATSTGVWTSNDGTAWRFTQLVAIDPTKPVWRQDRLSSILWDGSSFVASGGIDDPLAGDSGDADLAFWRSADGRDWDGPQVVAIDAAIRTSAGVDHLTANQQGTVVAFTATQRWQDGSVDALDRGTVIAVSSGGQPFTATHLSDWILYDTFPSQWGFMAAGVPEDRPSEPRLLLSSDGRSWKDVGPAPVMSAAGVQWQQSIVINGPAVESGAPNLTWQLPYDPNSAASRPLVPSTTIPPVNNNQIFTTQNLGPPSTQVNGSD